MKLVKRCISNEVYDPCWDLINGKVVQHDIVNVLDIWNLVGASFQFPVRTVLNNYLIEFRGDKRYLG